ncbi:putative ABC transporter ATP-binding protein YxlF [Microbacterium sp. T2.11-28]|nr:putative ABC transporter ATP-binding protein YxlF [Microbacterium sp. T2.11-28]
MTAPVLDVHVARFSYRRGEPRLIDVSVALDRGRTVLLGPNGAGKTTLLKAIAGVVGFEGSLSLDGRALTTTRRRPPFFRRRVGWLPQHVTAFPGLSVHEHVAYVAWLKGIPMRRAWPEAERALDAVGLGPRLDESAGRLSGGQTRRLGIAGVLVHDPAYLLLDEPTAGLDPRERERLVGILRRIEEDRAVLVSTHDSDALIEDGVQVHVLAEGSTQFVGGFDAFLAGHTGATTADRVRRAYATLVPED